MLHHAKVILVNGLILVGSCLGIAYAALAFAQ